MDAFQFQFSPHSKAARSAARALRAADTPTTRANLYLVFKVQDLLGGDHRVAAAIDDIPWLRIDVPISRASVERSVAGLRYVLGQHPEHAPHLLADVLGASTHDLGQALPLPQQRYLMSRATALASLSRGHRFSHFAVRSAELRESDLIEVFQSKSPMSGPVYHPRFTWKAFAPEKSARALVRSASDHIREAPFIEGSDARRMVTAVKDPKLLTSVLPILCRSRLLDTKVLKEFWELALESGNRRAIATMLANPVHPVAPADDAWHQFMDGEQSVLDGMPISTLLLAAGHPQLSLAARDFLLQGEVANVWEVATRIQHGNPALLDLVDPDLIYELGNHLTHADFNLFDALSSQSPSRINATHWETLANGSLAAQIHFARLTKGSVALPAAERIQITAQAMMTPGAPRPSFKDEISWRALPGRDHLPRTFPMAVERNMRFSISQGSRTVEVDVIPNKGAFAAAAQMSSWNGRFNDDVRVTRLLPHGRSEAIGDTARVAGQVVVRMVSARETVFAALLFNNGTFAVDAVRSQRGGTSSPEWARQAAETVAVRWTSAQSLLLRSELNGLAG